MPIVNTDSCASYLHLRLALSEMQVPDLTALFNFVRYLYALTKGCAKVFAIGTTCSQNMYEWYKHFPNFK